MSAQAPIASLKRRYGIKLAATIAAALTGIGVDMFASRALGPADYGNFYFLQQFFMQIFGFLSGSISFALITRVARRPHSHGFTFAYLGCLLAVPILLELFILLAFYAGFAGDVWPESSLLYVHLAALAAYFIFLGREGTAMGDAHGLTVQLELIRIVQRGLAFLLVLGLFGSQLLDLPLFFLYTCFVNALLAVALFAVLRSKGKLKLPRRALQKSRLMVSGQFIYDYSAPLITYSAVAMVTGLFDRWLLQQVSGSVDQGYFSLAYQISQMMMLFIAAFIPLLMREMSVTHGAGMMDRMARIFNRVVKNLYFVAAFGACFVVAYCDRFSVLVGGNDFAASTLPVAFVVLSTLHRTYGQVSGTLFFATSQTRTYRNIAIVTAIAGAIVAWIMIGPRQWLGLELGAEGLALKILIAEIISANIFAYFSCRYLKVSFMTLLVHQAVCAAGLLGTALAVRRGLSGFFQDANAGWFNLVLEIGLAGAAYSCLAAVLVYRFPSVCGMQKTELTALLVKLKPAL